MNKSLALMMTLASTHALSSQQLAEHIPGEVIIKFKESIHKSVAFSSLSGLAVQSKESLTDSSSVFIIENKENFSEVIKKLNKLETVEYAEPNFIYKKIQMPKSLSSVIDSTKIDPEYYSSYKSADPQFLSLWGLHNTGNNEPRTSTGGGTSTQGRVGSDINALNAWSITKGSKSIKIAIIDTGIDYNHVDLKENMWVNELEANGRPGVDDDGNGYIDDIHGYDFANSDGDPMDGGGHGTHCAGTIAASHNNGVGVAGVMAHAQLVAIKFLSDEGSGSTSAAIQSIDYAIKVGVDVMSNSWGGGGYSQGLKDAIVRAKRAGIVFTAAAGNSGTDNDSEPHYPSNYDVDNIISVAAHNYSDNLASFSCYGSDTVHVTAPGRNILSTIPGNKYAVYSGTSMATPHVSGVIGLYLDQNPGATPEEVRANIMSSSVYGASYGRKTISGGRVDAYSFLKGNVNARPLKPQEEDWRTLRVDKFESTHPYGMNQNETKKYTVTGAKFVRVIIKKYDIEKKYDSLSIMNSSGVIVEKLDGSGQDFTSDYVVGPTIELEFKSDATVDKWGYEVDEIQYIK